MKGVVLYGPPASGKDTITDALISHSSKFVKYALLKAGEGNQVGYRMTTPEAINELAGSGRVLWQSDRYNSTYAIDKEGFEHPEGQVSIVQLGQINAVEAIQDVGIDWLVVSLWCPREEAERRLIKRGGVDIAERLKMWDQTEPVSAHLKFDTSTISEESIVDQITASLNGS